MTVRQEDKPTPDQLAAHDLLSELRTRIATQPLPYQYGVEESALESLRTIFEAARAAMKKHPGCAEFARATTNMLNVDLRPVTAKWHRALVAGYLKSRDGANEFRADLARLQKKLRAFMVELQTLAYGSAVPDTLSPDVIGPQELSFLNETIQFGVDTAAGSLEQKEINKSEADEIAARREKYGIKKDKGYDAVGLALSGGGIRSATFCLGAIQVLVERGILKDIDYLSTVSGGGYIGSFVSSWLGAGRDLDDLGHPNGPDTEPIKHVRQNAKYLHAVNLKQRWLMATTTLAGLLLNWTAPLFVICLAALLTNLFDEFVSVDRLIILARYIGGLTAIAIVVYGIALRYGIGSSIGGITLAVGGAAFLIALALYAVGLGYFEFTQSSSQDFSIAMITAFTLLATPILIRFLPNKSNPLRRAAAFKASVAAAGPVTPLLFIGCFYVLREVGALSDHPQAPWYYVSAYPSGFWGLLVITACCGAFSLFFLDVNLTGPHKLYRDRLARTFIRVDTQADSIELDAVNVEKGAPYHLINATLNLPSSASSRLRDRRSDFFLFSKYWCGAPAIGYQKTGEWKARGRTIDLATAMAISGAAASPYMGLGSIPSLAALLSILNIRLGYWIGNPRRGISSTPGFTCLLREMTGVGMSERNAWLNLSDGGHIENTGLYELLRRRCKFIICIDGEADPHSTFHGQITLLRHAQIDFGVRLEPRFDEIRPDPDSKYSRSHYHMFRIHYPADNTRPPSTGVMLYLKLSLTGDEAELLKRYRAGSPDFPHESTLDQFFGEEQFEAYRQLGVHVAEGTFSPAVLTRNVKPSSVADWFGQLSANMLEPLNTTRA